MRVGLALHPLTIPPTVPDWTVIDVPDDACVLEFKIRGDGRLNEFTERGYLIGPWYSFAGIARLDGDHIARTVVFEIPRHHVAAGDILMVKMPAQVGKFLAAA